MPRHDTPSSHPDSELPVSPVRNGRTPESSLLPLDPLCRSSCASVAPSLDDVDFSAADFVVRFLVVRYQVVCAHRGCYVLVGVIVLRGVVLPQKIADAADVEDNTASHVVKLDRKALLDLLKE